jgi:tripartite-type tricarboxylate transporter receptor subunit TctC
MSPEKLSKVREEAVTFTSFSTRIFACLAVAAAALLGAVQASSAQAWPNKPITWLNPFAAGGGTDAFARPLATVLDQQLGQRVLIENKAGAGGTVGASVAAKANPDGYYFFVGAAHHTIAPAIYPKLDYDIEKDFIPVALIAHPPQVVVVHPERIKAKTLAELIAHARANPDKLTYASAGSGTTHHLAGELFKLTTKTKIQHVPYRGAGPAMQDLVAGHVDMMFDGLGTSATQINGDRLRGLAVAAPKRSPTLPNVPTSKEAGLDGYEVSTWYALFAIKGTPPEIVERMTQEVTKALQHPAIKEAWTKNGSEVPNVTGAQLGALVKSEVARWGKVVQDAGVKLEGN